MNRKMRYENVKIVTQKNEYNKTASLAVRRAHATSIDIEYIRNPLRLKRFARYVLQRRMHLECVADCRVLVRSAAQERLFIHFFFTLEYVSARLRCRRRVSAAEASNE